MRLELEPGADDGETYSVDEAIEAVGFGRYQVGVLLMAGLCWTADAMEMLLLSYIKEPMKCEWGISDLEAASVASAVGFGMLAGSTFWGVVADSFGRPSQRSPPASSAGCRSGGARCAQGASASWRWRSSPSPAAWPPPSPTAWP